MKRQMLFEAPRTFPWMKGDNTPTPLLKLNAPWAQLHADLLTFLSFHVSGVASTSAAHLLTFIQSPTPASIVRLSWALSMYNINYCIEIETAPQFGRRKIQGIQSAGAGPSRPADLLLSMISWSVGRRSYARLLISVPIKGGTNLQVVQQSHQHSIAPASYRAIAS